MSAERGILVSGNWKMHENHFEALKLVQELAALLRAGGVPEGREVSIHPPFTSLRTVQTAVETDHVPVALGAQNCHYEEQGAFTGEVSAEMLAKLNVSLRHRRALRAAHALRRDRRARAPEGRRHPPPPDAPDRLRRRDARRARSAARPSSRCAAQVASVFSRPARRTSWPRRSSPTSRSGRSAPARRRRRRMPRRCAARSATSSPRWPAPRPRRPGSSTGAR